MNAASRISNALAVVCGIVLLVNGMIGDADGVIWQAVIVGGFTATLSLFVLSIIPSATRLVVPPFIRHGSINPKAQTAKPAPPGPRTQCDAPLRKGGIRWSEEKQALLCVGCESILITYEDIVHYGGRYEAMVKDVVNVLDDVARARRAKAEGHQKTTEARSPTRSEAAPTNAEQSPDRKSPPPRR